MHPAKVAIHTTLENHSKRGLAGTPRPRDRKSRGHIDESLRQMPWMRRSQIEHISRRQRRTLALKERERERAPMRSMGETG
ncbi:hypothetical protein BofuT4_uP086800.1 [Botrytis cinerea T4]|uniref:Uncharacterized protein n=1 Tax=Botryotinia fuckeliana (strain T4) TaxID=999810 RepID=G2YGK3_BOTF4|nr:hypothetical protein BofuT4_uP086800.1 [Botrytis cinerea T4]